MNAAGQCEFYKYVIKYRVRDGFDWPNLKPFN